MNDRKEYMRQYRLAQKERTNMLRTVPELHANTPEQHANSSRTVPEQPEQPENIGEHVREHARTVFKHPASRYMSTFCLVLFIAVNTAFLINEQVSFYTLKGESFSYALFIATLTEIAAIFLSFFGTWYRRPVIFSLLVPTLALIIFVIFLGLERKENAEELSTKNVTLLQEEISLLKERKEAFKNVPTSLLKEIGDKQEELRKSITTYGSSKELWVLAALRLLAIFWNIAFASLIAFIWKGENKTKLFPKENTNG